MRPTTTSAVCGLLGAKTLDGSLFLLSMRDLSKINSHLCSISVVSGSMTRLNYSARQIKREISKCSMKFQQIENMRL